MSPVFFEIWQTFRLGMQASPACRAAYSTLRTACNEPKPSVGRLGNRIVLTRSQLCNPSVLSRTNSLIHEKTSEQSRAVNLWKSLPKEDAPQDAAEEQGLSISPSEVKRVFGKNMKPEKGVEILQVLQKHRQEGTLDLEMPYEETHIKKGLSYLRRTDPIDEDAAINARIDRELDRLPQTHVELSPHIVSQFEKFRQENQKKAKLEEVKRAQQEKEISVEAVPKAPQAVVHRQRRNISPSNDHVEVRPEPEWVRNYRRKATNDDWEKTIMPMWSRLLPSAAVTVTVVALSVILAKYYTPPSRDARLWPNIPPAAATMATLIGLNVLVWLLWKWPPLWSFMNRNFLLVPVYPHCTAIIGSAFSHQTWSHLAVNMAVLWVLGTRSRHFRALASLNQS